MKIFLKFGVLNAFAWVFLILLINYNRFFLYKNAFLVSLIFFGSVFICFFYAIYTIKQERKMLYYLKYAFFLSVSLMFFGIISRLFVHFTFMHATVLTVILAVVVYTFIVLDLLAIFYNRKHLFYLIIYGNNAALFVLYAFKLRMIFSRYW